MNVVLISTLCLLACCLTVFAAGGRGKKRQNRNRNNCKKGPSSSSSSASQHSASIGGPNAAENDEPSTIAEVDQMLAANKASLKESKQYLEQIMEPLYEMAEADNLNEEEEQMRQRFVQEKEELLKTQNKLNKAIKELEDLKIAMEESADKVKTE